MPVCWGLFKYALYSYLPLVFVKERSSVVYSWYKTQMFYCKSTNFGVSPSVQCTIMYVGATNISENTQFAKYNSTPKFVDLQYLFVYLTYKLTFNPEHVLVCVAEMSVKLRAHWDGINHTTAYQESTVLECLNIINVAWSNQDILVYECVCTWFCTI